jgi:methylmalonyl-CoA mutase N-terminal domain/subunit
VSDERQSPSGLPVAPVYGPQGDGADIPGEFPFTRGIHSTMYRGRLWTMRQYAGFGTAEETNARFRALLDAGQTGLSVAFDLPTQMGFDSDAEVAIGEVGRAGVAIDTVDDLAAVFDRIPLDRVSTSMTINSTAAILLAMYIVAAEEQGASRSELRGTIQNDVLKEYVARGTYIFPVEPSLRLVVDTFAFVVNEGMNFNPISVSGYHMREAGATAVQEVAFTLAHGLEYLRRATDAGIDVNAIAPRMSFFFAAHNDLFEEVAKFRGARRMWAALVRERFEGDDNSCRLRFHTQTGGSTLTAQQPLNNMVRVTVQAMAAVLGGTQSLHTNGYDEALALPSTEAAKLALRTQQIVAHESGAAQTVDPLGGSYYVEHLTDEIETAARQLLEELESAGGVANAIETGVEQDAIARSAYQFTRSVESGKTVVVGVNQFAETEPSPELFTPDYAALADRQRSRLEETRRGRDSNRWKSALDHVAEAAKATDNLMPPIIDAVRARATIGEISDILREQWGTFRPIA